MPTVAVPEIVGGALLAGLPFPVVISPVGLDARVVSPELSVAVTANRIVAPRTADVTLYVVPVAPAMPAQAAPFVSHRSQA